MSHMPICPFTGSLLGPLSVGETDTQTSSLLGALGMLLKTFVDVLDMLDIATNKTEPNPCPCELSF